MSTAQHSMNPEIPENGNLTLQQQQDGAAVEPLIATPTIESLTKENDALKQSFVEMIKHAPVREKNFFPALFTPQQRGALAQKYAQKYAKMRAESAAHQSAYPEYSDDTAMLYALTQLAEEANAKIAADARDGHISNLYTITCGYTLAEVLTEFQVSKNKENDREIVLLADKIGENHRERVNILKAVRKYWLTSFDVQYKDSMDKKLRRTSHILKVDIRELE